MPDEVQPTPEGLRHRIRNFDPKVIVIFLAIQLFCTGGIACAVAGFFYYSARHRFQAGQPSSLVAAQQATLNPPAQPLAPTQLRKLREQDRRVLTGYGWVDRKAKVVRIPIGRAMDLVATRGLPVFPITTKPRPRKAKSQPD